MPSKPWFDAGRETWYMKYKPDPAGAWKKVALGKQPPPWSKARPPKTPPQFVKDRAREFEEIEYRAKHQMSAAPKRARSLTSYVADYIDAYATSHSASSLKQLKRHAKNLLAMAKERKIDTVQGINKAFCRDYLEMRVKVAASTSLQTEKGYLGGIWSRAVEDELITMNPWHLVKVPGKQVESEATFWSQEEILAIAATCKKPWHSDLIMVLAGTGIRVSATLAMRWDWIDFADGMLLVPKEHSKSGRPYKIAMTDTARGILERRAVTGKGSELVFPNPKDGSVVPYTSAASAIDRAIAKAGVKHGTTHDLRHSYGRWLAMEGKPFPVIQSQLGHTTPAMTGRYTKIGEQEAKKHVEGMRIEKAEEPPAESA